MKSRRWLRFALPLAVVAGLATVTGVAHVVQQPDPTDASFLSPTSDAGDGARQLANDLVSDGVRVTVREHSAEAIADASAGGPVTVIVTTPQLVHPEYLDRLTSMPAQVRVVLVAPGPDDLAAAGLDISVQGQRWTASAPQPGCSADFASAAGPAAVYRWRYGASSYPAVRCYEDGLVEFRTDRAALTLVGAADPFRNDRADEHGNRALARGLLGRSPAVIWLDLHEREPGPDDGTGQPTEPDERDSGQETDGDGDSSGDRGEPGDQQEDPAGDPQDGGQGEDEAAQGGGNAVTDSPLARAFPPAVWATLALLALAALALAAASARRLGAPVAEPLPVRVRAAETVRGLGALYRRAGARSTSLVTLQSAARIRLAEHYGLPADVPADEIAERVAATVGRPVVDVRHLLSGAVEDSDEELTRAATTVQNLVRFVTGQQNWQQGPDEGNVT